MLELELDLVLGLDLGLALGLGICFMITGYWIVLLVTG